MHLISQMNLHVRFTITLIVFATIAAHANQAILNADQVLEIDGRKIFVICFSLPPPVEGKAPNGKNAIAELADAGTASEKEKPVGDDSGFFWRLNSYWRFKQENGGVFIECESISLSRSIPFGFGWLVKGYVESVPRESLEGTLTSIRQGVAETARGN